MSGTTVLIANPCDAELALLGHALTASDFNVIRAACAKEAIETAQSQTPQLIILDTLAWETPTQTTLTVLKHNPKTARIPVVVFGNARTKEEVTDAIQKGAATWVGRKGFDLARFVEKLLAIAAKAQAQAAQQCSTPAEPVPPCSQPTSVEKVTPSMIEQALSASPLPVFEFSVMDAVTTTCSKEQAAQHVSEIAARDPAMTLALLAAASAHADGEQNQITDPRDAVARIGVKDFYRLAESVSPLRVNLSSIWDPGYFWAHSVATARIAGMISRMVHLATPAAAVSAGLLHDLGYYVLANLCPKQYGALFSAGLELDSINPLWEKNIVGAHHGEIGSWVMKQCELPAVLADAAAVHHAGGMIGQTLTPLSRLVAMVVQAADCLASALFPADPPLMSLVNPFEEFEAALDENNVTPQALVDEGRKIIAELLTELAYLFPQSVTRSFFYRSEPLARIVYFAPQARGLDVFREFLQVRSQELMVLDGRTIRNAPAGVPMVMNLSRVTSPNAQIEVLSSLMAARVLEGRTGVVLVPAALPDRAVQSLVSSAWRLVPLPAHSSHWVRFLSGNASTACVSEACVA